MFKFSMRDRVRDTITGYEGIVTSRTEWMNGCVRYGVQPTALDKDGKIREADHFDEQQLELVSATEQPAALPGGGPQHDERSPFPDA